VKARFPGTCGLCHRRYAAGTEITRVFGGSWGCPDCSAKLQPTTPAPSPVSAGPEAGPELVRQVLAEARAVAARADAAAKAGGRR
jgi:hypothetical protein